MPLFEGDAAAKRSYASGMKKALVFAVAGIVAITMMLVGVALVFVFFFSDATVKAFGDPSFQAGYFEAGCLANDKDSCFERALIAEQGLFGELEDAVRFHKNGCRLGHAESCKKVGALVEKR